MTKTEITLDSSGFHFRREAENKLTRDQRFGLFMAAIAAAAFCFVVGTLFSSV